MARKKSGGGAVAATPGVAKSTVAQAGKVAKRQPKYEQGPRDRHEMSRCDTDMLTEKGIASYIEDALANIAANPSWMMHRGGNQLMFSSAPNVDYRAAIGRALAGKLYDLWVHDSVIVGEVQCQVHVYASRDVMRADMRHNVPDVYGCLDFWRH